MHRVLTFLMGAALASVVGLTLVVPPSIGSPADDTVADVGNAPPSRAVPLSEYRTKTSFRETLRRAVPAEAPAFIAPAGAESSGKPADADAKPFSVPGRVAAGARSIGGALLAQASRKRDPYWPLGAHEYPNRMVGKLVFKNGGPAFCTAAVVAADGGGAVLSTAGHCVYDVDAERWSTQMRFCPGYRFGCRLGWWKVNWMTTTNTWVDGVTSGGTGVWDRGVDDFAVVSLFDNSRGSIGAITGYQGITFNNKLRRYRLALGYAAPDSRSRYHYSGKRLAYCEGWNTSYRGELSLPCTMTGGSSGGPWISNWDSDFLGYVNSVNSQGPSTRMVAPYFDDEEKSAWISGSSH